MFLILEQRSKANFKLMKVLSSFKEMRLQGNGTAQNLRRDSHLQRETGHSTCLPGEDAYVGQMQQDTGKKNSVRIVHAWRLERA